MQKNIKRILSLVLVIVLCFSAVPLSAFATDDALEGPYEVVEAEEMPSVEPDEHEEVPPGDEVSEEPSVEPETFPEESDPYEVEGTEIEAAKIWPTPMRRAAMAASVGSSSVLKIGNNCFSSEVGLLPTLNLEVHYLPAKTMLSGSTHTAAYCLDAHLGATDGANYTWSDLSKNNQNTIAAILALGFRWNSSSVWSGPSDNADKWAVTQLLVWEAAANNIFLQANGLYGVKDSVDADINKAATHAYNPSGFKSYYESIKKKLNEFRKIPSFAGKNASEAETITLKWDGSKYSATVSDSNKILDNFDFSDSIPGVTIYSNGNNLSLSTDEPILSPKTSNRVKNRNGLAGGAGAVAVWRTSDSSQQDFATYNAAGGEPVSCYIKVKTDAVGNAGIVKTAEDGKVEGLQFQITGSDGSSTTKTTDANGNIDIDGLPIYAADGSKITYTATEINVPSKYVKPESQTFQLSEGQTASLQFDNKLKRWRVTVTKVDSATGSTAQGNGSLAGAKYGVYKGNELIKEYTTDENGQFTTDYYPYGEDWTLREISASEGYKVSSTATKLCEIPAGTNDEYNDNTARVTEEIMRGGVSVEKRDSQTGSTPQGDASFAGIVFEIINNSANPVEVDGKVVSPGKAAKEITTNAQGFATTGPNSLPYGDYIVREKSTNASMLKTFTEELHVTVTEDGKVYSFTAENDVVRGGIALDKHDSQTGATPQGNADFAGITFEIVNSSAKAVVVDGTTYAPGQVVATLTTDANGHASTADNALPYGRYLVREKATNSSMLLTWREQLVTVSENKKVYSVTAVDDVVRGGLAVEKRDSITGSTPQGDAGFEGITFEVINNSKNPVIVNDKSIAPGEVALTLTTDSQGKCSTANNALPFGEYILHEKSTNESMLNTAPDQTVIIGEHLKVYTHQMDNEVVRGGVLIEKRDLESQLLTPLGGASLDGTLFEITNKSKRAVYVDGALYEPDTVCLTIEVKDGIAQSDVRALPYGTYSMVESKPGTGYLWTDKKVRDFTVRKDGEVTEFREGDAAYNQVKRGDLKFVKVGEDNMHRFANVAFKLTSQTTGESHILVTDQNGEVRTETKWNAHTLNTNGNDDKPEGEWTDEAGTWFGKTTEDWMVETQDGLCALPYDYYTLEELRCEGNEGYALVTVPNIFISRDSTVIRRKGGLLIRKTSEDDFVEGISFIVTGGDYEETFVTDKQGQIYVQDLLPGEYTVTEVENDVTAKYIIEAGKTVTITSGEEPAQVEFHNKLKRGSVYVVKTAEGVPNANLPGAEFAVYADVDGNAEFDPETDTLFGKLEYAEDRYSLSGLPVGGYFLHEEKAPEGYAADKGYYFFKLTENGERVEVANTADRGAGFVNERQTGSLRIVKVEKGTDKPLEGAVFCVMDKRGEMVAEGRTGKDGVLVFEGLPVGSYTYQEVCAPEGYKLDDTEHKFEIGGKTLTVEVTVGNEKIPATPSTEVPKTGDTRPDPWLIGGAALAMLACAGGLLRYLFKRRRN